MRSNGISKRDGVTLTELIIAMAMMTAVVLGAGAMLVGAQRSWSDMYRRLYSDVASDANAAKAAFEAVVRRSSIRRAVLADDELEVYYYSDTARHAKLDRYARFYIDGDELLADYGELDAGGTPQDPFETVTLARDVESVDFSGAGTALNMVLRLDNGCEAITVLSSPVRHNE